MRTLVKVFAAIGLVVVSGLLVVGVLAVRHGFSARDQPMAVEAFVARRMRSMAMPASSRDAKNPVPLTPDVLARARAHFADHCASCHGNDGRGKTPIGRKLYPNAPDMWAKNTQGLTDGEVFTVIRNGVRLTGMPAWGENTPEDDRQTWELVHFIRHLPQITPAELDEMKRLNPKSASELQEEEEEKAFLAGGS